MTVRYYFRKHRIDDSAYRVSYARCNQDGKSLPNGRIAFSSVNRHERNAYLRTGNPTEPQRLYYAIQAMIRFEYRVDGYRRELDNHGIICGFRRVDFRKDDAAVEACKRSNFDMSFMYPPDK